MRRTLPALLAAVVLLAACSSDDDTTDTANSDAAESTTPGTAGATDPTATTDTIPAVNPDKPVVEIPDEIPTELQVTVLEEGSGPEAQVGDTVIVDYVGVRSRDGEEFDNSYDPRQPGVPPSPFSVQLGAEPPAVIVGWDQGLRGVQAGSRVQLDIPSDLAYGPEARGDIIGPDEALTFVIDVRAVVTPSDPADAPTEPGVELSTGADDVVVEDLVEGSGDTARAGQSVVLDYVIFRGDNGTLLANTWGGDASPLPLIEGVFPVLVDAVPGMQVGGRRAITFPPVYPDYGFGPEGRPTEGLPADTDVIIVVDLRAVYGTPQD
jgi:FKBP-type peptidyl-prolyl cis-trans isomerase